MPAPLEPGFYQIYYVISVSPSEPVMLRPLSPAQSKDGAVPVVALPEDAEAPVWHVIRYSETEYTINLEGSFISHEDKSVVLKNEEFMWHPSRGAICPPPTGNNGFVVGVGDKLSPRWEVTSHGIQVPDIPVELTHDAGTILYFKRVY